MSEIILDLVHRKVDSSKVRRVSSAKGGEYHSPCPVCGGNNRFHVWPDQEGGATAQRAGVRGTFWCRKCDVAGDVIDFLKFSEGLDYKAACDELRIELNETSHRIRPLRQPKHESTTWTPAELKTPSEPWRAHATKIAWAAHEHLLTNKQVLAYLSGRGLPFEAVVRYRLGYLEGEDKTGTCLFRARSAFGLPNKKSQDGAKAKSVLWIPRGLAIPLWSEMEVLRIRIRRRKEDMKENGAKYMLLEGSGQAPMVLPPEDVAPGLATWVVTESELDACAVHHACGRKVGVLASLTNLGKPDAAAHRWLSKAKLILVALDFDKADSKGKRAGYQGWTWWKDHYAVAKRWPVPQGKDPGEAFALGVDLAGWIRAADGSLGEFSGSNALKKGAAAGLAAGRLAQFAQADMPLADAVYPDGFKYSTDFLRAYYAGKSDCDDVLVTCPLTNPAWGWRCRRACRACNGHQRCIAAFLFSPQMLAPIDAEATA